MTRKKEPTEATPQQEDECVALCMAAAVKIIGDSGITLDEQASTAQFFRKTLYSAIKKISATEDAYRKRHNVKYTSVDAPFVLASALMCVSMGDSDSSWSGYSHCGYIVAQFAQWSKIQEAKLNPQCVEED